MRAPPTSHVLFVSGFDRRPARRIWSRQRAALARSAHAGNVSLSPPSQVGNSTRWMVCAPGKRVSFEVLEWSDLVRDRFECSLARQVADACTILLAGVANGFWRRVARRKGGLRYAILLGFLPVFLMLLGASLAFVWLPFVVLALAGLALCALPQARYIQNIAWGARALATGRNPRLEHRIAEHGARLSRLCGGASDPPVRVMAHSLGAAMALRIWQAAGCPPNCHFLAFGESIPLVSDQKTTLWETIAADLKRVRVSCEDVKLRGDPLVFRPGYDWAGQGVRYNNAGPRRRSGQYTSKVWAHFSYFGDPSGASGGPNWLSFLDLSPPFVGLAANDAPPLGIGRRRPWHGVAYSDVKGF